MIQRLLFVLVMLGLIAATLLSCSQPFTTVETPTPTPMPTSVRTPAATCWSAATLSNAELANLVIRRFPNGVVPQTGENIRVTAYAVARAESGGNPSACGDNNQSIGLWQINMPLHPQYSKEWLLNPDNNADAAVSISGNGLNWNSWCTWEKSACNRNGNEAYKPYLSEARAALGVSTAQQYLVISGGSQIFLMSPTDGTITRSIPAPCSRPESLAWDGEYLWVASFDQVKIYKMSLDGTVLASFPAPEGTQPNGLAWDGRHLWMSSYVYNSGIYELEPSNGSVVQKLMPNVVSYPGRYGGLEYDIGSGFLWLADPYGARICKCYPNMTTALCITAPDRHVSDLAWDGTHLWTQGYPSNKVYELNPNSGGVISSFSCPTGTQNAGMTFVYTK